MHTDAATGGGHQRALLLQMQRLLQHIYDADSPHRVPDFLITDAALAQRLQGGGTRPAAEKLLLHQADDGVSLSLYLESGVLRRLAGVNPVHHLPARHMADFCTVLEGVSHFIYVAWNAAFERAVTPLELEMQAEVDKFVSVGLLLAHQGQASAPHSLHRWLFDSFSWDGELSGDERDMYRDASTLAARYCRALQVRYLDGDDRAGLMRELRRFWRLTRNRKIERIRELA